MPENIGALSRAATVPAYDLKSVLVHTESTPHSYPRSVGSRYTAVNASEARDNGTQLPPSTLLIRRGKVGQGFTKDLHKARYDLLHYKSQ